jgi:peptidoglycan glycosyltransferase
VKGRITGLTLILVLLFGLILGQAWFVQVHRASALNGSPDNPKNVDLALYDPRGEILSTDGTVLARSIPTGDANLPYRRSYPYGALTSDVVGYSSSHYGTAAIEYEYNQYLLSHTQPPRGWSQLLSPVTSYDNVQLTLSIPLQQVAARALAGRDGAVVAIDPRDGNVLAMYSNPSYNPAPLTSTRTAEQIAAFRRYTTDDADHFPPLGNVATQESFPPGSTFKVVTTSAIYRYFPALANAYYTPSECLSLQPYSTHCLQNSDFAPCGGTIAQMLPASCDPGYAWLGLQLGAKNLYHQAAQEGYNAIPPLDLGPIAGAPAVVASHFPSIGYFGVGAGGPPALAFSAIGQDNVRATALQDALVAAGIANRGRIDAPHFLRSITDEQGNVVRTYQPWVWRHPLSQSMAANIVPLMYAVTQPGGTASLVGFLPQDYVAAKTGTAQTGDPSAHTDDWMIAFAPYQHPVIAVAVVLPFQPGFNWGATTAGPVMKCVIEGALAVQAKQPPAGTATTCPK